MTTNVGDSLSLQRDVEATEHWVTVNKLNLNSNKRDLISFGKKTFSLITKINGVNLKISKTVKYLNVHRSTNLSLGRHAHQVVILL